MNELVEQGQGGGLDDRQKRLVEALSIGFDDQTSSWDDVSLSEAAGYASAQKIGSATRSVAVQGELKVRRVARLKTTMAAKALKAIESMVESDKTPAATRFSAAKWILEQAGHTESQADASDKPLHEMTEKELLAFMAKAQRVVEQGGEPPIITVTPRNGA